MYCDSNYAGCLKTRKSTQGGVIMHGTHCIKSWSSTQGILALSSAEAEYYGIVKAASQGIGMKSLCKDFDRVVTLEVLTDASAARSIANRQGLGKLRHIDTHFLWVQDRVHRGDFVVSKVWGKENPADLLTKFLDAESMKKCLKLFGIEFLTGRSAGAPQLSSVSLDATPLLGIRRSVIHKSNRSSNNHNINSISHVRVENKGGGLKFASSPNSHLAFWETQRQSYSSDGPQNPCRSVPSARRFCHGGVLRYNARSNDSTYDRCSPPFWLTGNCLGSLGFPLGY